MAVCMIFAPPKDLYTKQTYEKVIEYLGDNFPPRAMSLHVVGSNEQGEVRIVDIFESQEEFDQFAESHAPILEKLGVSLDAIMPYASFFEVEKRLK